MIKKLKKYFLLIDMYGNTANFTIKGNKTYQTFYGSIVTLFSYIIILIFFIIFSKQIIYHSKPNVIISDLIDPSPLHYLFSNQFIWTISLQYLNYSNYIDETVYNLDAYVYISNKLENGKTNVTKINLNPVKCSTYSFKSLPEYFNNLPLDNLYCVNLTGIELRGVYMEDKWTSIDFKFMKCKNTTYKNICKGPDEIENALKGGYVGIFASDYQIIPTKYKNPVQMYGINLFTSFTVHNYKDYWIYYQTKQIKTDKGFIFDSIITETYLAYESTSESYDYRESDNFLTVYIRKSTNRKLYERNYLKFQDIAANIGGIIKIITLMGEIITYYIKKTLYKNFILQFFNLDEEKYEEIKKNDVKNNSLHLETKDALFVNNLKINKSRFPIKVPKLNLNSNKNTSLKIKTNIVTERVSTQKKYNSSNKKITNLFKNKPINKKKEKTISIIKFPIDLDLSEDNNKINYYNNKKRNAEHIICFLSIFCKKNSFKRISEIHNQFEKIKFLFDIIQYIKMKNIIKLLEKIVFTEQERNYFNKIYHFDYDFYLDKNEYDYLFV